MAAAAAAAAAGAARASGQHRDLCRPRTDRLPTGPTGAERAERTEHRTTGGVTQTQTPCGFLLVGTALSS